MIIKNKVYKFEICYIDYNTGKETMILYSDSKDIHELENIPQTTFRINSFCKDLNQYDKSWKAWLDWEKVDVYLIGDKITLEEAKEEIDKISKIPMIFAEKDVKNHVLGELKLFCKYEKDIMSDSIYINKNINLNDKSIMGRILLLPDDNESYKFISPNQLVNGRIYLKEEMNIEDDNLNETNSNEDSDKKDDEKSYIELE